MHIRKRRTDILSHMSRVFLTLFLFVLLEPALLRGHELARAVEFVQQRVFSNSNHNGNRECVCSLIENSERKETLEFPE